MKIRKVKLFIKQLLASVLLMASFQLVASPLSDARSGGLVKELPSGYVVASKKANDEVKMLVKDVNQRRRAAYQRIAKKHGIDAKQVAAESYAKRAKAAANQ